MMPRPQFTISLRVLLVWLFLLPAVIGTAYEGFRQAQSDEARLALTYIFVSGAILGACVGFTRGRSIVKGALLGMLFWPTVAMLLIIVSVICSGSFTIQVY
jgi:4-hydroxybenzoate polyprenyltransferase